MDKLPKIFLSYAKEDKQQVDKIYLLLMSSGLAPWMDKPPSPYHLDGIQPGERWEDCIRREMNASDFIFAFLSKTSIAKKGYVQREYRMALDTLENFPPDKIHLIPVLLDECEPPDLRVGTTSLRDLQYYDFPHEGIEPLINFVKKASGIPIAEAVIPSRPRLTLTPDQFKVPPVVWSCYIGSQKWKNTPIYFDSTIYVGSAGSIWNKPDPDDGIYAIHPEDGSYRWFCPTGSDVNEILVTQTGVIGGTDDGHIWCIDRQTGENTWKTSVGAGILQKPILLDQNRIFIITYDGMAVLLDYYSGERKAELPLEAHFVASSVFDNINQRIIAPAIEGTLFLIDAQLNSLGVIKQQALRHVGFDGRYESPKLYCAPVQFGDSWIQGFVRDTYYDDPAFMALDLDATGDPVIWYATDSSRVLDSHGNIRSAPLLIDDDIVFGSPYSQSIVGIDATSGQVTWHTILGVRMFPHWPSPIGSEGAIYLPRHDGYLYEIDRTSHQKNWSLYLGKQQFAGIQEQIRDIDFEGKPTTPFSESGNWEPLFGSPIYSTPCLDDRECALFVGTDEGILYRIDLTNTRTPQRS